MAKRKITPINEAPSNEKGAEKPSKSMIFRFSEEDLRYVEELQKDTGISNASDVIRFCLRVTAKERKVKV